MPGKSTSGRGPIELHRHNLGLLGKRDIVVAGEPGSGAALLSNIVLELGFDYLDPYTEMLDEESVARATSERLSYRRRLPATAALDHAVTAGEVRRGGRRFVKTHFYPDQFSGLPVCGAILLVRDPRDATYSSFNWFRGFSRSWWPGAPKTRGKDTFVDFLDSERVGDNERPASGWAKFCRSWLEASERFDRFAVVRFEDLKANPLGSVTAMLAAFGLTASAEVVAGAVRRSSFDTMRRHEDDIAAAEDDESARPARIMRRGAVEEWREWYGSADLAERFADPVVRGVAARFGYDLTPLPERPTEPTVPGGSPPGSTTEPARAGIGHAGPSPEGQT